MSWTFNLAVYGAALASVTAVAEIQGRRGTVWARRAKHLPDLRAAVNHLRGAVHEARLRPHEMGSLLSTTRCRAHLDELEELQPRLADRRLAGLVERARSLCLAVSATPPAQPTQVPFAHARQVDDALAALSELWDRLDLIERKAP